MQPGSTLAINKHLLTLAALTLAALIITRLLPCDLSEHWITYAGSGLLIYAGCVSVLALLLKGTAGGWKHFAIACFQVVAIGLILAAGMLILILSMIGHCGTY